MADLVAPTVPLGYTFGRIGNFINGELFGRPTAAAWGMYFPADPARQLRHPSQLYEACGEGLLLFVLVWGLRNRPGLKGALLGLYLMGYGVVRFGIEFFRQPDPQLMYVLGPFSMGQVLCGLMVLLGALLAWAGRRARRTA
jgi:phosphatidylglycerol:prolipoprotein diacylglycerol transferase